MSRVGHGNAPQACDSSWSFLAEYPRLFDAEKAAGLNVTTVSFRDTEAFSDIPQWERRMAFIARAAVARDESELLTR